jgi:SAM-dependent methyltransferase
VTRDEARENVRRMAAESIASGDATGWFERLYAASGGDPRSIPWADMRPHPLLVDWASKDGASVRGRKTLVVGCGFGDDSEFLATAGASVTAFDVSVSAIVFCRERHAASSVRYQDADLLDPPAPWRGAFDLVVEIYTVQSLPLAMRERAVRAVGGFVAPGGTLLFIARSRDDDAPPGELPWPVSRAELAPLAAMGFEVVEFLDRDEAEGDRTIRRLRAEYRRDR